MARSQDVRSGSFHVKEAGCVSEETYAERISRAEPRYGDLLYSREGTYFGIAAEMPIGIRVCLGQRMVLIRPDAQKVSSRFLRYWLNSPLMARHIHGYRDGSVAERLNLPTIRGLPVLLLPIEEQHAVAQVLGTLDDKIDLNRRMNETLESMARAIFKDWFVDFGPVRAKIEGDEPYLAPEIWALFPAGLDDEGMPEGWKKGALRDVAQLNPETWGVKLPPPCIEYVDLANTKWGEIEQTQTFKWNQAPSRARRILQPGDAIVGTVRPGNGSFALVGAPGLTGSTGFAVLRPQRPQYREAVYLSATAPETIATLSHLADGAAYPAVRPEVVAAQPITISPVGCFGAFSKLTAPLIDRMLTNRAESGTLVKIRDLLLPKLISGEIRLREGENLVGQLA